MALIRSKRKSGFKTNNKSIKKFVEKCNNILINKENSCNCFDSNNHPDSNVSECMSKNNSNYCEDYNQCKNEFMGYMSESEPKYTPHNWEHPYIKGSHNCYTYFLNDHIRQVAKSCHRLCRKKHKNCPKKLKNARN